MAIVYSGGPYVKTTASGVTPAALIADIKTAVEAAGWTSAAASGGWTFTSGTTSQGLGVSFSARLGTEYDPTWTFLVGVAGFDPEGNSFLAANQVFTTAGRTYHIIASPYAVYMYLPGSFDYPDPDPRSAISGAANNFGFGTAYLPDPIAPLAVTNATNASPISITTSTAHGMLTGEQVYIRNVAGNTAANGTWIITVTGTDTFTLNGSVGSGTFIGGNGIVGNAERISNFCWGFANECARTLQGSNWRNVPFSAVGSSPSGVAVNETQYTISDVNPTLFGSTYPWRGDRYTITEPYLKAPNLSVGNTMMQAQLYDAMILSGGTAPAGDTLFTVDGHNWMIYNKGGSGAYGFAICYT